MMIKKRFYRVSFLSLLLIYFTPALIGGGFQSDGSFMFLRGNVRLMDGSPPPVLLHVELVCARYVREQIYTDENGQFVFQLDQRQSQAWIDASASQPDAPLETPTTPFKTVNLSSCEIRLTENQGYVGQTIRLGSRSAFDSPDVGDIFVEKEGSQQGTVISVTSLSAPSKAKKAFENALKESVKEKPDLKKVEKELKKAVKEYENYASAWQALGDLNLSQGKIDEAQDAFDHAAQADPRFIKPYLSLARLDMYKEDWAKALEHSQKVIDLEVRSPEAFYYAGLSHYFLGNAPSAKECFVHLKSTGSADTYPIALLHLGIIYAQERNPGAAGPEFERYLQLMPEDKMPKGQKEQITAQLDAWKQQGLYQSTVEKPD